MYSIDVEKKFLIASNDAVNCNHFFNKIKLNLEDFHYEDQSNNFVFYLISLSQVLCSSSDGMNS